MTTAQQQLITAAVDGELSASEDRAFRLLLASSVEARTLFAQLNADSNRVRALSLVAPPVDLHAKIMTRIAGTNPAPRTAPQPLAEPVSAPISKLARRVAAWVPVAMAASVFLCLAAASFAFFTNQAAPNAPVAKRNWSNVLPAPHDSSTTVPSPTEPHPERPDPAAVARTGVLPVPRAVVPEAVAVDVAPEPRSMVPDLSFASPFRPTLPPFERVAVRLPFLRPVADLGREDISQELLDELRHDDPAFKFDLFVRDTARGVEVFQHAARAYGLTVFADTTTLERLKKKQIHSIVIYTESLTPAELAVLFAKLSAEDAKFSPKVCDSLHAAPAVRSEELELKAILGTDVGLFKRSRGASGAGQGGEPKNVSAETIDSVLKAVASPGSKPGNKSAVMLTWQTTHPSIQRTAPSASVLEELKQYRAKRSERKPNVMPAIIVIRPVG